MLVFNGREVVEVANKQPPSGMSMGMLVFDGGGGKQATTIKNEHARARFRWRRGGGSGKPAATIENEHARARFRWWRWGRWQTSNHHRKRARAFDGGEVVVVANQQRRGRRLPDIEN